MKVFLFYLCLSILMINFPGVSWTKLGTFATLAADSNQWLSGWTYRKEHNITRIPSEANTLFFDISDPWATISGDPGNQHAFQPVHNTTMVEVDRVADGATWKYFAYDSDYAGSEIRLYFTNSTADPWTGYSGNPILGPNQTRFRWPSVAYVNDSFQMFLDDRTNNALERWTSRDGTNFTFVEKVMSGAYPLNPFIWFNPNDNRWFLYSHDAINGTEYLKARDAANIGDLGKAKDTIVLSRAGSMGSPAVAYCNGQYWLLAEIFVGGLWKTVAYYSKSPSAGFEECYNSPILSNDEACSMFFLDPNQTHACLFSSTDSSNWFEKTREVYVNSAINLPLDNLYGYQVRITAHYGNGTDNGENVYLNNHSRTDFGDVRFTWFNYSSLSEVECPYWIEDSTAQDDAQIWVTVPEISVKTNTTIYVYYGKADAVTTSNGSDTFDFFDDFAGTLNKWTIVSGKWQIENGELSGETSGFGDRIRASGFSFGNNSVHARIEWISGTYFENGPYVRGQLSNEARNGYMTFLSTWGGDQKDRISKMSGGQYGRTIVSQGAVNPSKNVWYECVFKLYGNRMKSSIGPLYSDQISGTDDSHGNGTLCLFSWSASSEHVHFDDLFVCQYVEPEPSHDGWGIEEQMNSVVIDQTLVSDRRADVGSIQAVRFHAKWNNNASDVSGGNIYVNSTGYVTNSTGWIDFSVSSHLVGIDRWVITGVNCSGENGFLMEAQVPNIIWDRIKIIDEDISNEYAMLGDRVAVWAEAVYEYDNGTFDLAKGILYVNGLAMSWSMISNRWEYDSTVNVLGSETFAISGVQDNLFNLTVISDPLGAQTVDVWSTPFFVISNSTVSELVFNSTKGELSFTVSGPSGTIGCTNVTMAKTTIHDIDQLKVYLDGNEINHTTTVTDYYWLIYFNYTHSVHKVTISLESPRPEPSPSDTLQTTLYMLCGITIAIMIIWLAMSKRTSLRAKRVEVQKRERAR